MPPTSHNWVSQTQDLGPLLSPGGLHRLAHDRTNPQVIALVEAGAAILMRELIEKPGLDFAEAFKLLNLPDVQREASENVAFEPKANKTTPRANTAKNVFDERWRKKRDYVEDVLSVALNHPNWFNEDEVAHTAMTMLTDDGMDFDKALHILAYQVAEQFNDPYFRLQIFFQALAPSAPISESAINTMYQEVTKTWVQVYQAIIEHHQLRLRTSVSIEELAYMLSAMAEGLSLRRLAQKDNKVLLDREKRTSLIAKGAFAIFCSCVQREDDPDTQTLALLARNRFRRDH